MQIRSALPLLVVFVLSLLLGTFASSDPPRSGIPLDLPSGGLSADDDDESVPELITFFGEAVEGDGFFFCFNAYHSP